MKNTDLHIKILLQKCWTALIKVLVLENKYKIVVPLFGAAYAAPPLFGDMLHQVKTSQIYIDLGLQR